MSLRPYLQLVRLPAVFTAMADICLAALAAHALPGAWAGFVLLLLASSCLYLSGMAWNDFFDVEQDRRERPSRPIPSGKVSRGAAGLLASGLMGLGLLLALLAGWRESGRFFSAALALAGLLAGAILLYDGWLKRTWAGPLGMGACRFLNVLLGLTLADRLGWPWGAHLALVVGLYVVGVTWFARTEARTSSQAALAGAALVLFASLLVALAVPARFEPGTASLLFPYLLVGLGFLIGIPVARAISSPSPARVQSAVRRALAGLVVL
ncbi:MAG TPA: UbiA family prenyltransferase, partial [Gemmataceae bacterium]|nr:UbiA family prenyltransferase [Gemmataceae bacterium]